MLKRIIKVNFAKTKTIKDVCMQFDAKKGKVTLGGDVGLQEIIWDIYTYCFGECDGEPHFYTVVRGKTRINFNCNIKNYSKALDLIAGEKYEVEEVESFERRM